MQINWPEGLSTALFLRDYWQQKPLLIRNAIRDWDNPLDVNDLAGLAMEEEIPSRLVWERGPERAWQLQRGPFDEQTLSTLPRAGWSLLVSDIEKHLPEFSDYLQPFRFIPDWRIDDLMISAAPDGGSVGAHIDDYDVFLFQACGVREWSIGAEPESDPELCEGTDLSILRDFNAAQTWQLEPGDLLYLPPRIAHHGVARGDDCMTWSVGFRAPSAFELAAGFLDDHASLPSATQRYRDPQRAPSPHPGEIASTELDELVRLMRANLADDARLYSWLGCFLSEPAPPDFAENTLDPGQVQQLERRSDVKFLFHRNANGKATLFAGGECFACSVAFAIALTQHTRFSRDSMPPLNDDDRTTFAALWSRAWLQPATDFSE